MQQLRDRAGIGGEEGLFFVRSKTHFGTLHDYLTSYDTFIEVMHEEVATKIPYHLTRQKTKMPINTNRPMSMPCPWAWQCQWQWTNAMPMAFSFRMHPTYGNIKINTLRACITYKHRDSGNSCPKAITCHI